MPPILIGRDGRFISKSASHPFTLSVWSAVGTHLTSIGRAGRGPGEFSPPYFEPFGGPDGSIYVRTTAGWTVFSKTDKFAAYYRSNFTGEPGRAAVLDDGRILSSSRRAGPFDRWFHILDVARDTVFSFGDGITPFVDSLRVDQHGPLIAYGGGTSFIVAPLYGSEDGYSLGLWSTSGVHLRTLRRDVDWFPNPAGNREKARRGERLPPPPVVREIAMDASGLVYVYLDVTSSRRVAVETISTEGSWYPSYRDRYVDVLDPLAGEVLASMGPLSVNPDSAISHIPGTRYAWQGVLNADGLLTVRIEELRLVPR
jgi:hypothetical protein